MARTIKDYDERRKEIIETSMKLFLMSGYENTSVNLIINTIGVSKGTFYYYFKSKEDLLDAIAYQKSEEVINKVKPIVDDNTLNAIDKMNRIYQYAIRVKVDMKDLMQMLLPVWLNDEYLIIRYKMEERNLEAMTPVLMKIVLQGMKEQLFHLDAANGVPELLLKLGTIINDTILKLFNKYDMKPPEDEVVYITNLYQMSMERILGAPKGSIKIFDIDNLLKITRHA